MNSEDLRIVAILRGVTPDRIVEIGHALFGAGIRAIEIPLNSPEPFPSIEKLVAALGDKCLCGAGTVLSPEDVRRAADAGAKLIVSPNTDAAVIGAALKLNLLPMPGVATPSNVLAAIDAGATHLKLFPASTFGPNYLRALKPVLPKHIRIYAVGGVAAADVPAWLDGGAAGFGFGSELFKPDYSLNEIAARAKRLMQSVRDAATNLDR